jgi:hypothetical protein
MWVNGQRRHSLCHSEAPLRFVGKFMLDVLPAALASVIGGILFTQFHPGNSPASQAPAEQVSPASAEVLALVRDEHAQIVGYLKSQMAAEKKRLDAEDAESARAVEDSKVEKVAEERAAEEKVAQAAQENNAPEKAATDTGAANIKLASQTPARHAASSAALKPTMPRARPAAAVTAAGGAPLVIAQADQNTQPDNAGASDGRLAHEPDSLLAKTLDLKDQVVAATRHAVSAIGDVFTSVGEHITGSAPSGRQFSTDS